MCYIRIAHRSHVYELTLLGLLSTQCFTGRRITPAHLNLCTTDISYPHCVYDIRIFYILYPNQLRTISEVYVDSALFARLPVSAMLYIRVGNGLRNRLGPSLF